MLQPAPSLTARRLLLHWLGPIPYALVAAASSGLSLDRSR